MEARKGEKRRLTEGEISMANRVFNGAVNLRKVRVYSSPSRTRGSLVHKHTVDSGIYCPTAQHYSEDFSQTALVDQAAFIHEMAHVWQNQTRQRHTLSHKKYHDYINQVKGSMKAYLKHRGLWRNYRKRPVVFDEVGGPLSSTRKTSPVQMPTRISATQIDGSVAVRELPGAAAEDVVESYMRDYNMPNQKLSGGSDSKTELHRMWTNEYHYNYLLAGSEKIVFAGLTREGQAEMIMDYFILLNGGNPMNPVLRNVLPDHVPKGWQERPPLGFYKKLIPFVTA
ncbi:hypothetical protein [Paracoccus methylarcula]|uniref:Uncharacterized protein n=1 Tax=Paracoccus methylarcula TaxID=72022 RepID=A0A3R7P627_9RHOB|nr:hypothetical protein [Paracoccus methylarcula]RNF35773.1 hypothetical protein A7A09_005185 [Paracoccus methylarcula]